MIDNYPPGSIDDPKAPWNEKDLRICRKCECELSSSEEELCEDCEAEENVTYLD